MRIFLIGFMGVGKSTLGQRLAERLQMPFLDLDDWIEDKMEMQISEIFARFGETYFRKLEHDELREIIQTHDRFVMATGGGLPCHTENMAFMNEHGLTVYLEASPKDISSRLRHSVGKRPVLDAMDRSQLEHHIASLLGTRSTYYRQAKLTVNLDLHQGIEKNLECLSSDCLRYLDEDVSQL